MLEAAITSFGLLVGLFGTLLLTTLLIARGATFGLVLFPRRRHG